VARDGIPPHETPSKTGTANLSGVRRSALRLRSDEEHVLTPLSEESLYPGSSVKTKIAAFHLPRSLQLEK